MQLRHYLSIVLRFWPLVLALPIIVGIVSFLFAVRQPVSYLASADFLLLQALPVQGEIREPSELRDQWGGTEYVIDDLPQVVASTRFAQDVSAVLTERGIELSPAAIKGSLSAQSLHRTVTINAVSGSSVHAVALVEAAVEALRRNGLAYWGRSDLSEGSGLEVSLLNISEQATPQSSMRRIILNTAVRAALGLAAGIALAFLFSYLDTRIRSRYDVEEGLGLPVVGMIPPE